MNRTLSSGWTVFWKFVFPALWIAGFAVAILASWNGVFHGRSNEPSPEWLRWEMSVCWLGASAFLIWDARQLHRVSLQDGVLTVSNYFREFSVPVTAISGVTQSYLKTPPTVSFRIKKEAGLKRTIMFIPEGSPHFISEYPITTELRNLSQQRDS